MNRIVSWALLFAVLSCGSTSAGQQPERLRRGIGAAQLILDVLSQARVSGSLEYSGRCGPNFLVPNLPPVFEPEKPYPQSPGDTFRSMFEVDPRMSVTQDSDGTIRVVENEVQTDILHVKINHLAFNGDGPEGALHLILTAPEIQSFMQTHSIGQPFNMFLPSVYDFPQIKVSAEKRARIGTGARSISGELDNVSLSEALDYVLKAFPGFWVYQDCQSPNGQRLVYFGLFPLPGTMWPWDGVTLVK